MYSSAQLKRRFSDKTKKGFGETGYREEETSPPLAGFAKGQLGSCAKWVSCSRLFPGTNFCCLLTEKWKEVQDLKDLSSPSRWISAQWKLHTRIYVSQGTRLGTIRKIQSCTKAPQIFQQVSYSAEKNTKFKWFKNHHGKHYDTMRQWQKRYTPNVFISRKTKSTQQPIQTYSY